MKTVFLLAGILLSFLLGFFPVEAHEGEARYLANEGVMVSHGDYKILFDPLFHEHYGQYQALPEKMAKALMAGEAPFDGIDAVFISHHHGDHFAADSVLALLIRHQNIHLYAPQQAVDAIKVLPGADSALMQRIHAVTLAYLDSPVFLQSEGLTIGAVRIPHSGWPERRLDVENIAWRVTFNDGPTVAHFGDADPNHLHFSADQAYWLQVPVQMAFPPYWFFNSTHGPEILTRWIRASHTVGVHVPVAMPDNPADRPDVFEGYDLFTEPGERRTIVEPSMDGGHP